MPAAKQVKVTIQGIVIATTMQDVGLCTTEQHIIAAAAIEDVGRYITREDVTLRSTGDQRSATG